MSFISSSPYSPPPPPPPPPGRSQKRREEQERRARRGDTDPRYEYIFQVLAACANIARHQVMDHVFEENLVSLYLMCVCVCTYKFGMCMCMFVCLCLYDWQAGWMAV